MRRRPAADKLDAVIHLRCGARRRAASSRRVRGWGLASFFFSALAAPGFGAAGAAGFTGAAACAVPAFFAAVMPAPAAAAPALGRALALRGSPAALFPFLPWLFSPVLFFCPPLQARPAWPRAGVSNCAGQAWARTGMARLISFQCRQDTAARPRSKSLPHSRFSPRALCAQCGAHTFPARWEGRS